MPSRCWKAKNKKGETVWRCKWGDSGKVYESKDRARAKAKADKQGRAIRASGYKG